MPPCVPESTRETIENEWVYEQLELTEVRSARGEPVMKEPLSRSSKSNSTWLGRKNEYKWVIFFADSLSITDFRTSWRACLVAR